MSKLKLLYGELDEEVLASQAAELQKAGYSRANRDWAKSSKDFLKKESFDLIVLGQTLSRDDRHHLPYMAKKAQAGGESSGAAHRRFAASLRGRQHRHR